MVDVYQGILKRSKPLHGGLVKCIRLNVCSWILEQTSNPRTSNIGEFGSNFSHLNSQFPINLEPSSQLPIYQVTRLDPLVPKSIGNWKMREYTNHMAGAISRFKDDAHVPLRIEQRPKPWLFAVFTGLYYPLL